MLFNLEHGKRRRRSVESTNKLSRKSIALAPLAPSRLAAHEHAEHLNICTAPPYAVSRHNVGASPRCDPAQVKSNSQRVIGRSTHSLDTPVWSSYGGGGKRFTNAVWYSPADLRLRRFGSMSCRPDSLNGPVQYPLAPLRRSSRVTDPRPGVPISFFHWLT